ncbi:site-specific integrase [Pseudofrankia sp. BMG5.37]|uniref:tyrosine-type recombinase/integrase n=1 Tax=Pseudofrankia sp. BMG5.37 TaxID=3050035 RepID=UPI002895E7C9|nr:site-specific integrase [Pseudofrankia sp. BMG5.37]MDT3440333.1 site-specific integrase [Pseudofrankia sp. BMG5.37]
MGHEGRAPGAAGLHLARGVPLLRPEEQVFAAMVEGWRNQQLARNLALSTIYGREKAVQAFARHADAFPWQWTAAMVDDWLGDLRAVRHLRHSTVRSYQEAVRAFCHYLTDPAYDWSAECERQFGTHPVQVVHAWNTAVHVQDNESAPGKRAFTLDELEGFFDHADGQVARVRAAGRKGWLSAFRDATLFKVAYGYGLRRNETRMLDVADLGRNPHAPELGDYGVLYVRHGKAMKGSPPKRRSVLTVWDWVPEILDQWVHEVRPLLAVSGSAALWPSERAERVALSQIDARFAACRDAVGLDRNLDFHSLRRSYVTHLIEAGRDALFVQHQVGHEHASTTSLYTCVSSDFRTRTLRRVLDDTMTAALRPAQEAR